MEHQPPFAVPRPAARRVMLAAAALLIVTGLLCIAGATRFPILAGGTTGLTGTAPSSTVQVIPPAAADPSSPSGNWMTDLLPAVDPGGGANWEFRRNGAWGATDGHTVYIDPDVPVDKRFSVMIHEYSHVLQVLAYGSLEASASAMSAGSGISATAANESTADCMALMQGATWVDYGCRDSLRGAAESILAEHRNSW